MDATVTNTANELKFDDHANGHANVEEIESLLRSRGLRVTQQRVSLWKLLFKSTEKHLTAEVIFRLAQENGLKVSLATVYNCLKQFADCGLVREVWVDGVRSYFDTIVSDHHHFFVEETQELIDIPGDDIMVQYLNKPPVGTVVDRVDVVIRLRKQAGS